MAALTCFLCRRTKRTAGALTARVVGSTQVELCIECARGINLVDRITERLLKQATAGDDRD